MFSNEHGEYVCMVVGKDYAGWVSGQLLPRFSDRTHTRVTAQVQGDQIYMVVLFWSL